MVIRTRLHAERDAVLRDRALAVASTIYVLPSGTVNAGEHSGGEELGSGIWIYAGHHAVERPIGGRMIQTAADALAGEGARYAFSGNHRLYAQPVFRAGTQVATVVASSSNTPYEHALAGSVEGSFVVAILVLVGAYPVLRFAAGRALRPVGEMTRQAGEWSMRAPAERFGPEQRFREVQSLASTLDAVLDRLNAVMRHERRLLGELSHELRTPLARIVAETDLLLTQPHTLDEANDAHKVIRDSAMSMNKIIDTLLESARLDAAVTPGRCDLEPVITALIHTYSGETNERGAPHMHASVGDDLAVGVDAAIVERVLAPLLDNARRYATDTVSVVAHRTTDSVLIDICDDGPGVPTELREAIFAPGWRAQPDDGHRGAGLGLALSRRLARSGAGDVHVVGSDSRFQVRMPPA